MKNKTAEQMKHNLYSHDEARWMNKQRIKHSAKRHKRKLSKREIDDMVYEDYDYDAELIKDYVN